MIGGAVARGLNLLLKGSPHAAHQPGPLRRIIYGILWFFALYFFGCFLAGGYVGIRSPAYLSNEIVMQQAEDFATKYQPHIIIAAAAIAIVGTWTHILPGTGRPRKQPTIPSIALLPDDQYFSSLSKGDK